MTAPERRQRVFARLRAMTQTNRLGFALVGIALLAIAVNLVELLCSAGLPAASTAVLAQTPLPRWQQHLYLLLYVTVFMADDLVVFAIAMTTLRIAEVTSRYTRYPRLVGGVALIGIGTLLLLRPEWLSFGMPSPAAGA